MFIAFLVIIQTILITNDLSVIGYIPQIMKNFGAVNILVPLATLTLPADKLTKYCPSFNLIGLECLLTWWGVALISTAGSSIAYEYYIQTDDFVPNPYRNGLNSNNKSATISFLSMFFISLIVYVAFWARRPFKKGMQTNLPAFYLLIFWLCSVTFFFFFSEHLAFL